jgi:hypothetical protein
MPPHARYLEVLLCSQESSIVKNIYPNEVRVRSRFSICYKKRNRCSTMNTENNCIK